MSRLIDAFSQFFDGNGQPLSNGYLKFYENQTAILQDTYSDEAQTIPNTNPFQLTGDGRVNGNVYASLVYTVELLDSNLNVIESYDNVDPRGGVLTANTIPNWNSVTTYSTANSIVLAGDGNYYIAIQPSMNVNPTTDTVYAYWKKVSFNEAWSASLTYGLGDVKIGSDGKFYESLIASNLNNNPVGDGGVNWEEQHQNKWSIGRAYLAGESRLADNGRWYTAVINNTGNNPSSDGGTNWLPAVGKIAQPSNVTPAPSATNVVRQPMLTSSAFSVTSGSDTHEYTQWQLSTDGSFTTVDYNSNAQMADLTSHQSPLTLAPATVYFYRERYRGVNTGLSDWSTATSFTTVPDLASAFSIESITGNGTTQFVNTGVDLFTSSGSVFIYNRTSVSLTKKMDTVRGLLELTVDTNTPNTVNANGLQSYAGNGFTVGSDLSYNNSGDTISAYTFGVMPGFHTVVRYTGNGVARTLATNLGAQLGFVIGKAETATATPGNDWFRLGHKDQTLGKGDSPGASVSTASIYGAFTSTTLGIGFGIEMNTSGATYVVNCFAHNPAQGIYCGTYVGTGVSGNKITTGFPGGFLITYASAVAYIADIKSGTGSSIVWNSSGGNTAQAGSVASFDSDGMTLDGNNLNTAGVTYFFMMIADPAQF